MCALKRRRPWCSGGLCSQTSIKLPQLCAPAVANERLQQQARRAVSPWPHTQHIFCPCIAASWTPLPPSTTICWSPRCSFFCVLYVFVRPPVWLVSLQMPWWLLSPAHVHGPPLPPNHPAAFSSTLQLESQRQYFETLLARHRAEADAEVESAGTAAAVAREAAAAAEAAAAEAERRRRQVESKLVCVCPGRVDLRRMC